MAEGPGPGAVELGGIDVAMLDDLQGGDELGPEIALPPCRRKTRVASDCTIGRVPKLRP